MATAKPGDSGQAGRLDPKGPNKFTPQKKSPPKDRPDHGSPGEQTKKQKGNK